MKTMEEIFESRIRELTSARKWEFVRVMFHALGLALEGEERSP